MDFLSVKAQHYVGALDLEATDSTEANSIHVLDSKAMVSVDSKAQDSIVSGVAMDSIDALDLDVVSENVVATDSEVVPDSVVAMNSEKVPDSVMAMDSEEVPDSVAAMESEEVVPDSIEEVHCPRCGTFHAGGVFREACFQARRNARKCGRCGLLHEDYDMPARFLHDMDKFDCEFFIPDVEKLEMRGETIVLPEHVIKKLEDKLEEKISTQSNKGGEATISKVQYMHLTCNI